VSAGEIIDEPAAEATTAPLAPVIGYRLRRLQARWVAHWAMWFRDLGVTATPVQGGILLLIRDNPGITQVALSRLLQVEAPTLLQALAPLLRDGLVTRSRSSRDRRAFKLGLSDPGRSAASVVERDMIRHEADLLSGLSADERATLLALLDKALASADEATAALSAEACRPGPGTSAPLPE